MTVDQAARLRELVSTARAPAPPRARVVAVTSGKGGVGKSSIALNLAVAAAGRFGRTVLVDADLGLANLDVMCGLSVRSGLADVIAGRKRLSEIILRTPYGVELVPGASGIARLADLGDEDRGRLLSEMHALEREADLVVVDTGAGVARNVVRVAAAADEIFVVATPEPTSITDAYATIKLISRCSGHGRLAVVVNQASSRREATRVSERIAAVSRKFLAAEVRPAGCILTDPRVARAVRLRRPLVKAFPASSAALGIAAIARGLPGANGAGAHTGFIARLKKMLGGEA